jgi:outer membrane immunogenic protein
LRLRKYRLFSFSADRRGYERIRFLSCTGATAPQEQINQSKMLWSLAQAPDIHPYNIRVEAEKSCVDCVVWGSYCMLRGISLASAGVLALMGAANASDIYAPGPGSYKDAPCCAPVWTGFYVGENGGYGLSVHHDQLSRIVALQDHLPGSRPEGAFAGGQIGYNWQGLMGYSRLVLGVEADIQWSGINDKTFDTTGNGGFTLSKLDWFGTVRGRLGYAFEHALIYGTGGLAYGGIHNRVELGSISPPLNLFDFNGNATGYAVGGGLEYKLAPGWSVKTEYQYINLGINDPVRPIDGTHWSKVFGTKVFEDTFNIARIGLNYHFGYAYEPLK